MDTRQLIYFLGVLEHGGFSRAAQHLHVSQPALSQAIIALERDLGIALFHRVPSGAKVTDAGRTLEPHARRVLRDMEVARAQTVALEAQVSGQVDIALMPSQAVEPFTSVMSVVAERYPLLTVRALGPFTRPEAIDLVSSGRCELGLIGALPDSFPPDLEVTTLGEQRMMLMAPQTARLPTDRPVTPVDLTGLSMVAAPRGSVMRQVTDMVASEGNIAISVEVEHRSSVLSQVLGGVGVAVMSAAWSGMARRMGAQVLELEPTLTLQVDLIRRSGVLTPAASAWARVAVQTSDLPL